MKSGKRENPNYGIIDSRSVKTRYASEERGYDGGKHVKGRKHHIVVDTLGNLLSVTVHAANIHDTKSGINPAKKACRKYPTIKRFCGDEGYRKSFEEDVAAQLTMGVDISARISPVFEVLPKRWLVERTFAWTCNECEHRNVHMQFTPIDRATPVAFPSTMKSPPILPKP